MTTTLDAGLLNCPGALAILATDTGILIARGLLYVLFICILLLAAFTASMPFMSASLPAILFIAAPSQLRSYSTSFLLALL